MTLLWTLIVQNLFLLQPRCLLEMTIPKGRAFSFLFFNCENYFSKIFLFCFSHHVSWAHSSPVPSNLPSTLPPPPNKARFKRKKNGENKMRKIEKGKELCHGSCSVTQEITPYTRLSIHLYQKVFIAPSLWPNRRPLVSATLDAGLPLGLFLDILLVAYAVEILQLWVCGQDPFMWRAEGSQVIQVHSKVYLVQ